MSQFTMVKTLINLSLQTHMAAMTLLAQNMEQRHRGAHGAQ